MIFDFQELSILQIEILLKMILLNYSNVHRRWKNNIHQTQKHLVISFLYFLFAIGAGDQLAAVRADGARVELQGECDSFAGARNEQGGVRDTGKGNHGVYE